MGWWNMCMRSRQRMKLFCFQMDIVKSVKTRTETIPYDKTVTRNANFVYTDVIDKTVTMVKDTQIYALIKLKDWKPLNVCSTSSGYFLVFMNSDDNIQTKLVRYCESVVEQTIQLDENGEPFFFNITSYDQRQKIHLWKPKSRYLCIWYFTP